MHPREGWLGEGVRRRLTPEERVISRRELLGAGAGLSVAALLAGCGSSGSGGGSGANSARAAVDAFASSAGLPLARPNHPVKWPIYHDNRAIASGLEPEKNATLQIYNWVDYINEATVKAFCKKYHCKYTLTTFNTMTEAMAKLGTGQLKFDVFFPTVDVLGPLVASKLIRPLNHSYIPNIANAWPDFRNPFYDQDWRYTVPWTIYTTGIAWRKDKVDLAPSWNMPWQAKKYKGKVALLDDYRETISLALIRSGNYDVNTTNPKAIAAAGRMLSQLDSLVNVRVDNNDYSEIPNGDTWIHQAWSGDMSLSAQYMPKGTPVEVVRYWVPPNHRCPVANDTIVNLAGGENPVLAHLFIDYFLNVHNALNNYSFLGYMQPLTAFTVKKLESEKLLPPTLRSTVVLPDYFRHGVQELELPPAAQQTWLSTYNSFSKGL